MKPELSMVGCATPCAPQAAPGPADGAHGVARPAPRHTGTVEWYKAGQLNYGFIAITPELGRQWGIPPGYGLFVHAGALRMALPKRLLPGDRVEFEVVRGPKGPRAEQVRVLAQSPHPAVDRSAE